MTLKAPLTVISYGLLEDPIITIGLKDILDGRQTIPRAASQ